MCCGGKTTTPDKPRSPFEALLWQTETEIARVTGRLRSVMFEFNPTADVSRRWEVYAVELMPEVYYGETGESALRRCLEALARKPTRAA
jgi:hypothetical protein